MYIIFILHRNRIFQSFNMFYFNYLFQAAQKVAASKPTIAGVGNLRCVPFLDELK